MFDNQESPRDVRRVQRGAGRGRVPVAGLEGHRHLQEEAQEYPCTGKAFTWIFKQRKRNFTSKAHIFLKITTNFDKYKYK